jgi:hypothetical protein
MQVVSHIETLSPPARSIRAWRLQSPQAGPQMNPFALALRGWVIGAGAPVRHVEVLHGTHVAATLPLQRPNLEVAREVSAALPAAARAGFRSRLLALRALRRAGYLGVAEGDAARRLLHPDILYSGFDATLPLLGLPAECTLRLVARLAGGEAVPLADIAVRRPALALDGVHAAYQPLMVTSIGRSGSTWFQHLLAQHPAVAAFQAHSYEASVARELVLLAASSAASGPYTEAFFSRKGFRALFTAPGAGDALQGVVGVLAEGVRELAAGAVRGIDRFYALADRMRGRDPDAREGPRYFTEKNLRPESLFWELYPGAREIFLVRDFRDVICSSLAANAKWGKRFFGRGQAASDRDYVFVRAAMARPWILEPWRQRGAGAHLVRYEELILDPEPVLRGVLQYLRLDASDDVIRDMLERASASQPGAARSEHMTSSSAAASIGRWKTDLEPSLVRACDEAFAEFYDAFYPAGATAGAQEKENA